MNDQTDDQPGLDGDVILPVLQQEVSPAIAAEINQQVATAHRFPRRPIKQISDEIMSWATLSDETASECMYSLSRGGKTITGPSIRFAEIVRAAYGNMRVAARFVRLDLDDPKRGAVIVEAVALDLERNQAEVIPVRRSVMTSAKNNKPAMVFSADMINMTVNAASSLARRNSILAVVPKSFWQTGYQRVVSVLKGDVATLGKRRADILAAFGRIGVKAEIVFAALGVKTIEDITIEHMPQLVGFMTAIRDGELPDNVFARTVVEGTATPAHEVVKNPLRDDPNTVDITPQETQGPENIDASGELQPVGNTGMRGTSQAIAEADKIVDGAGTVIKDRDGVADAAKADPAPAKAATAATGKPTNAEEYRVYALAWINSGIGAAAKRKQWTDDRALRKACALPEAILSEVSKAYQDSITTAAEATT